MPDNAHTIRPQKGVKPGLKKKHKGGGESIYGAFTRLFSKDVRKNFHQMVQYSNLKVDSDKFLGFIIFTGIGLGFFLGHFLSMLNVLPPAVCMLLCFLAVEALFYFYIQLSIDSKARFVESVLPDALQLMSSNIRAGVTTDRALLLAARPEFGALAEEIRRVGKETMTGSSLAEAMLKMNQNIKSENLSKTLDLIVSSISSGGKLADLLDQISNDLRDQQIIQKEISASVLMYALFIFIAIALASPLLLAMSSILVEILGTMSSKIDMPESAAGGMGNAPISMTSISVSTDFLLQYSIVTLLLSSFFGSLVIGLILKGNSRDGLKYAPAMIIISLTLFFLGSLIMKHFFGQIIGV